MPEKTQLPEIVPVSKFNDYIPHPSCSSIRQLIFFNTDNFNEKVLRRIGNVCTSTSLRFSLGSKKIANNPRSNPDKTKIG